MSTDQQAAAGVDPEVVGALRRCPVFGVLTDAEVGTIAGVSRSIEAPAGAVIVEQGSPGDALYVIDDGSVEVVRDGQVAAKLGAGDFFGEMAMFNRAERVAGVRALEPTRLVEIPNPPLQALVLQQDPAATKLVQQLGTLTLERMQRTDDELTQRLAADDPASSLAAAQHQQLRKQLLAGWALAYHAVGKPGKLGIESTKPSATAADLSVAYSPGVAEPCLAIHDDADAAYTYTSKGHLVGVISNGTAVLGLGDIGALASKPVMEGKAILFKRFADVDAFDIEVDETDPTAFVDLVERLAPTFGGINLEDIAAPHCFWIEQECQRRLDIPVMHDDQHGTAIIAGAGLLNALEMIDKRIEDVRVIFSGAGAAGVATAHHLIALGVAPEHVVLTDRKGVVHRDRDPLPDHLTALAVETPARTLAEALIDADVFIGVSAAGVLTPEMLGTMARDPIVFALANPVPEIDPQLARQVRSDVIIATGRSDHPNQVNNVLAFPYLFRGALDVRARAIDSSMKLAATAAIAELARQPIDASAGFDPQGLSFGPGYLIPKPFDRRLLTAVAPAVAEAAVAGGLARRPLDAQEYRLRLQQRSRR